MSHQWKYTHSDLVLDGPWIFIKIILNSRRTISSLNSGRFIKRALSAKMHCVKKDSFFLFLLLQQTKKNVNNRIFFTVNQVYLQWYHIGRFIGHRWLLTQKWGNFLICCHYWQFNLITVIIHYWLENYRYGLAVKLRKQTVGITEVMNHRTNAVHTKVGRVACLVWEVSISHSLQSLQDALYMLFKCRVYRNKSQGTCLKKIAPKDIVSKRAKCSVCTLFKQT